MNAIGQIKAIDEILDDAEVPKFTGSAATVDRVAIVIVVTQLGLSGMHRHADVDGNVFRPSLSQEKLLGGAGCAQGICSA